MIYTIGTIAGSGNTLTGTGTNFTAAGTLIRNGCTVIVLTSPPQAFQITGVTSATQLAVSPAVNPAIPGGTRYTILLSDSLSVDGLALDIAETFGMYQRYMGGFADVMTGTGNVTITINGVAVTVPAQKSLAQKDASGGVPVNQGGTGATTAAGARTNLGISDKQLNSVDGKSGGNITTAVSSPGFIAGSSPTPSAQGHYFGWNEYGDGAAILQNNRGGGSGGFRFRTVNSTNTAEISVFHLAYTGVGYAPGGWQTGSDERIKEDINDIDPDFALNAVLNLRHVTFKMRDRPDGEGGWVTGERSVGYLAQDLEQYLPDAVNIAEISEALPGYRCRGDNNELLVVEGMKSIDPGKAGAALNGAAIKALYRIMNDENTELRNEVSELKEMIMKLMDQSSAENQ
ncbi:tail fiber domain-containing protein [Enterobacter sp. DE0047]|uniref:tail fiber domain-containing protein n=1 Tax=Enterobacter sp. DE0047 TaxID=2584949 RepID=UPI001643B84B|nr:tail fiber domain-containing protein [Enterobacter sp. DE0047]